MTALQCSTVRTYLSAAIDGEAKSAVPVAVTSHLDGCADCRLFGERATVLTRQLRMAVLAPVPDLRGQVLDAIVRTTPVPVTRATANRAPHKTPGLARWAAAVIPLGLAVSSLASGAFGATRIVPSHPVTPCTASLARHHDGTR